MSKHTGSRFHKRLNRRRWEAVRLTMLNNADWRCSDCRRFGNEVHHVVPLHKGGAAYDLDNLAVLCRGCHQERHRQRRPPEAWRRLVAELA